MARYVSQFSIPGDPSILTWLALNDDGLPNKLKSPYFYSSKGCRTVRAHDLIYGQLHGLPLGLEMVVLPFSTLNFVEMVVSLLVMQAMQSDSHILVGFSLMPQMVFSSNIK
ncbi:hypothetical protein Pyn_36813 [Prunus yedoensis var. nudiflora]|uniref:Uncharacterized protein n=1 Tax=Prunus yedoensis var. nudiflora TaxID=2094558 RepID=A0A314URA8_PRUYE|nr:hypothetical protein Pyn_36813 [Prunus yedoensis var. nudiflora]